MKSSQDSHKSRTCADLSWNSGTTLSKKQRKKFRKQQQYQQLQQLPEQKRRTQQHQNQTCKKKRNESPQRMNRAGIHSRFSCATKKYDLQKPKGISPLTSAAGTSEVCKQTPPSSMLKHRRPHSSPANASKKMNTKNNLKIPFTSHITHSAKHQPHTSHRLSNSQQTLPDEIIILDDDEENVSANPPDGGDSFRQFARIREGHVEAGHHSEINTTSSSVCHDVLKIGNSPQLEKQPSLQIAHNAWQRPQIHCAGLTEVDWIRFQQMGYSREAVHGGM